MTPTPLSCFTVSPTLSGRDKIVATTYLLLFPSARNWLSFPRSIYSVFWMAFEELCKGISQPPWLSLGNWLNGFMSPVPFVDHACLPARRLNWLCICLLLRQSSTSSYTLMALRWRIHEASSLIDSSVPFRPRPRYTESCYCPHAGHGLANRPASRSCALYCTCTVCPDRRKAGMHIGKWICAQPTEWFLSYSHRVPVVPNLLSVETVFNKKKIKKIPNVRVCASVCLGSFVLTFSLSHCCICDMPRSCRSPVPRNSVYAQSPNILCEFSIWVEANMKGCSIYARVGKALPEL